MLGRWFLCWDRENGASSLTNRAGLFNPSPTTSWGHGVLSTLLMVPWRHPVYSPIYRAPRHTRTLTNLSPRPDEIIGGQPCSGAASRSIPPATPSPFSDPASTIAPRADPHRPSRSSSPPTWSR